jgi:hypothetical protein
MTAIPPVEMQAGGVSGMSCEELDILVGLKKEEISVYI